MLAAKHSRFVDDHWSVDELLDLGGKLGRATDPGSSTQCEWALSFVFTVHLGHLRVSMALQSKYLCVRTPNTTIPCGQRNFSREVDHEHR